MNEYINGDGTLRAFVYDHVSILSFSNYADTGRFI